MAHQNRKNMKKSTATTPNQKSATFKSYTKESKVRKKLYENWQRVEATNKYQRTVAMSAGKHTTEKIAEEILNGNFLNLNRRSQYKSWSEQKRILRRIVEKRQAQAIHFGTKKSRNRKTARAVVSNTSLCMARLNDLRFTC